MKNYNKILEAVNRGIQFALDDFEPEEVQLSKPKQETINKEDSLYKALKLRDYAVDLGLPSGTLWCRRNLGASETSNPEDWYGDYYAWGEIHTKHIYSWSNYKWCKILHKNLTKYCSESEYGYNGFIDNYR